MAKFARVPLLSLLLVNCLNLVLQASGANILTVLPSVWKSHYIFGRRLLQQLSNHSVTIISAHAADSVEEHGPQERIRELRVAGLNENWLEMGLSFDIEQIRQNSVLERFTRLIYAGATNVDLLLADKQVRKLLRSGEKFDLLIVDLYLSDSLLGLAQYYGIPTVVISPTGANTWHNQMLGNPQNSALDPSTFLAFEEHMNIWERSLNTLMGLFEKLTYNFFHMISQQAVYAKHFEPLCQLANATLPHYRELTKNISLVLINSHPIIQYPRAYLPNMLEIAGVHLHSKQHLHLPNHLNEFITSAKEGVVYMSLGAMARTADLAREKLDAILDTFSYLKDMRFLLKWEQEQFIATNLPNNVMIDEWFPQEAILAHANVKVFISACGLLSIVEAINGQTPILALPIYPEQEVAAKRLQRQGVALNVNFDAITYDKMLYGIQQLAFNATYAQNIAALRQLMQADFGSPHAKALHYIELVLKTQGAQFLKSHANQLNFMRAELVDVLAIIVVGLVCIIAVPFFVTCCILRKSYYNQTNQQQQPAVVNYRAPLRRSNSCLSPSDCKTPPRRRASTSVSTSASSSASSASGSPPNVKQKRDAFVRHTSQSSQQSDC